jgi:polyphosphate glucokinase
MKGEIHTEQKRVRNAGSTRTLAVDIGGSGIKAIVLDDQGQPMTERSRIPTPPKATPKQAIDLIRELAKKQGGFDRVSVGFPGVVKNGIIYTAANLGKGWNGFDFEKGLRQKLKRPVRVANDADVQGLGCVTSHGLELVITLGTGFGSVVFVNGARLHLELGHHPFHKGRTYEDELGRRALKRKGQKKWNQLLREAIDDLDQTFNYDRLYIGGGNTKFITFKLPATVKVVSNEAGLLGGIKLWQKAETHPVFAREQPKPKTPAVDAGGAGSTAPPVATANGAARTATKPGTRTVAKSKPGAASDDS